MKTPPRPTDVHKIVMPPAVAKSIINKAVASLKIPLIFPPGHRLWLVEEVNGNRTGRADLVTVIGTDDGKVVFERRDCHHQGKFDDDLSYVGLKVTADNYPAAEVPATVCYLNQ